MRVHLKAKLRRQIEKAERLRACRHAGRFGTVGKGGWLLRARAGRVGSKSFHCLLCPGWLALPVTNLSSLARS